MFGDCASRTALRPSGLSRQSSLASQAKPAAAIAEPELERCEYCECNRHRCGCEDAFEYEQIRDNPTLFAR